MDTFTLVLLCLFAFSAGFVDAIAGGGGLGGILDAGLAIKKGNKFIRIFFLFIISATLPGFGYDVFFRK